MTHDQNSKEFTIKWLRSYLQFLLSILLRFSKAITVLQHHKWSPLILGWIKTWERSSSIAGSNISLWHYEILRFVIWAESDTANGSCWIIFLFYLPLLRPLLSSDLSSTQNSVLKTTKTITWMNAWSIITLQVLCFNGQYQLRRCKEWWCRFYQAFIAFLYHHIRHG